MASNATTIELNGKRYDTLTGKLLGDAVKHHAAPKAKVIDFVRSPARSAAAAATVIASRSTLPAHHTASPKHHAAAAPAQPKVLDIRRTTAGHAPARQPQHAKTLMRHAVSQPNPSFKHQLKVSTRTDAPAHMSHSDVLPKLSAAALDEERLKRAKHIPRSGLVRHFDGLTSFQPATASSSSQQVLTTGRRTETLQPATATNLAAQVNPVAAVKQPSNDIFERALARANSHKQPPFSAKTAAKKSHSLRHIMSVAASSLAIVLIIGFIAYQNASAIQLRLASSRAGINATLPNWRPDGFTIGAFAYGPGTVTVKFHDANVSRNFSVTQAASGWDSSALLSDFVLANNNSYDTIRSEGTTIYTYGNNNATWVNGGIWYKLTTDGSLSTSQLVKLASSM
jgi:hypothetical protein